MTNLYTLAFIFNEDLSEVLLIKKERPEWQKGFLNGIGGKIEKGETPLKCVEREVFEECGLKELTYQYIGSIAGSEYDVYVYSSMVNFDEFYKFKSKTDEKVSRYWVSLLAGDPLLPSVKYLVPMAMQPFIDNNFKTFKSEYE